MANVNDDPKSDADPDSPATSEPRATPEPPYTALFPNLDKVSSSTFRKGTLSRRRINIALLVLVGIAVLAIGLVVLADALFGPR